MKSVLQDWVMELGLRHQGVLLTVVRGCDTAPKEDASKALARCIRAEILNCHCGDPKKAQTFIEWVPADELTNRMRAFLKNHDNHPWHYIAHLTHAVEIIAYKKKLPQWEWFYYALCRSFHLNPETEKQLDERLNMDEDSFGRAAQI